LQGYRRADLWDVWSRYLPKLASNAASAEQTEQSGSEMLFSAHVPSVPAFRQEKEAFGADREVF